MSTSRYGEIIDNVRNDLCRAIAEELGGGPNFQEDPLPGQIFAIVTTESWGEQTMGPQVDIAGQIWVTAATASFVEAEKKFLGLLASLDSLIPCLKTKVDGRRIFYDLERRGQITKSYRAPLTSPNSDVPHVWVGDILAPVTMKFMIQRNMLGGHL